MKKIKSYSHSNFTATFAKVSLCAFILVAVVLAFHFDVHAGIATLAIMPPAGKDALKMATVQHLQNVTVTPPIRAAAAKNPDLARMVAIVDNQKALISGSSADDSASINTQNVSAAQNNSSTFSFPEGVTIAFGATNTTATGGLIFLDAYGFNAFITGKTNGNAIATAVLATSSMGANTAVMLAATSAGKNIRVKQIICTKADGAFTNVTFRYLGARANGDTAFNKALNFAIGLPTQTFSGAPLLFNVDFPLDGFTALLVNTGTATDFTATLVLSGDL